MVNDFTCQPDHQLDTGWERFLAANDSDDRLAGLVERTLDLATCKLWVRTTPSRTSGDSTWTQPRHYHGSSATRASRRTSTSRQVGNCFRHNNNTDSDHRLRVPDASLPLHGLAAQPSGRQARGLDDSKSPGQNRRQLLRTRAHA
jgi:hypothetical protein